MTQDFDQKTLNDISTSLTGSLSDRFGSKARIDPSHLPVVRSFANSFIVRFPIEGLDSSPVVLAKIAHRPHKRDLAAALKDDSLRTLAKSEMAQLEATWRSFEELGDPNLIAVQPLSYLEEWNAIVMLEVNARPLRSQLTSLAVGFSQAKATAEFTRHLRNASQWIRHYHNHVGGGKIEPVSQELLQDRIEKIELDVKQFMGKSADAARKLALLESKSRQITGTDTIAQLHGDFHCSNILVTPQGQICVLDPRANSSRRSIYNDLAALLTDLHLKPIPMVTGGFFTRKFWDQSRQAIIESYFKPGEYSQPLLDFYCASEVMFKWSMDERDFTNRKKMRMLKSVARPVLGRYMSRLTDRFLAG